MLERMPIELIETTEPPLEKAARRDLADGEVVRADANRFYVKLDDGEVQAQRAVSCLVVPEIGDRVLIANSNECSFVLGVLERKWFQRAELSVPAADATVVLAAGELELAATKRIVQKAPDVRLEANSLGLFGRSLSLVADLLTFLADRLHTSASQQNTVAEQIAVKARDRVTVVEGTETQKIGLLSQTVDSTATIAADNAIVTTRGDLRLDGERISMG
jgi:hypothetical protein